MDQGRSARGGDRHVARNRTPNQEVQVCLDGSGMSSEQECKMNLKGERLAGHMQNAIRENRVVWGQRAQAHVRCVPSPNSSFLFVRDHSFPSSWLSLKIKNK